MQSHQHVSACEIWVHAKQSLTSFSPCYFVSFHTQICKQRGSCAVISLVNILCSTDSRLLSIEAAAELEKRESESTCAACKHCNKEVLQSCWHELTYTQLCIDFCWLIWVLSNICQLYRCFIKVFWKSCENT